MPDDARNSAAAGLAETLPTVNQQHFCGARMSARAWVVLKTHVSNAAAAAAAADKAA